MRFTFPYDREDDLALSLVEALPDEERHLLDASDREVCERVLSVAYAHRRATGECLADAICTAVELVVAEAQEAA